MTVLVLPLLVLGLSGCVRMNMSTKIAGENEIVLSLDYSVNIGQFPAPTDQLCADNNSPIPGLGWQSYTEGNYTGCRFTGITNLSTLQSKAPGMLTHENSVWTFKFSQIPDRDAGATPLLPAMFDAFRVSVTFPGKVLTHSGSSTVSGSTVTWTNPSDFINGQIQATAKDTVTKAWWFIPGLVALGVAVLVVAGLWLLRRRRASRRSSQGVYPPQGAYPDATMTPPYPGSAGQTYPPTPPAGPYPNPNYGSAPTPYSQPPLQEPPVQQSPFQENWPQPAAPPTHPHTYPTSQSTPLEPDSGWQRQSGDKSPWE